VEVNTPEVDPSQGLVALPAELVDASNQIATGCAADAESVARDEFIITGRGGLPLSPTEPLNGEAVLTNWATLESNAENRSGAAPSPNPTGVSTPTTIVEAQGWAINNNGEVILTAQAPTVTPHSPWMTSANCHPAESSS
jgi:large exoprotein involved in heme utilization and adhesion